MSILYSFIHLEVCLALFLQSRINSALLDSITHSHAATRDPVTLSKVGQTLSRCHSAICFLGNFTTSFQWLTSADPGRRNRLQSPYDLILVIRSPVEDLEFEANARVVPPWGISNWNDSLKTGLRVRFLTYVFLLLRGLRLNNYLNWNLQKKQSMLMQQRVYNASQTYKWVTVCETLTRMYQKVFKTVIQSKYVASSRESWQNLQASQIGCLDWVLWAAARLFGCFQRFGHVNDYMRDALHWLPILRRIAYRVSVLVRRCLLGEASVYLQHPTLWFSALCYQGWPSRSPLTDLYWTPPDCFLCWPCYLESAPCGAPLGL